MISLLPRTIAGWDVLAMVVDEEKGGGGGGEDKMEGQMKRAMGGEGDFEFKYLDRKGVRALRCADTGTI